MLSDQEKLYLSDFLKTFDDNRLKSLSASVTMGRMNCNSREEAINCILLHSESLISLFHRKKVNASALLKYLHSIQIPVPGNATKDYMVKQIFDLWKVSYPPSLFYNQPSIVSPQSVCGATNAVQPLQISLADQRLGMNNNSSLSSLKEMIHTEKMLKEANAIAFDDFVHQFASVFYDLLNKPDISTGSQHSLNTSHFFEKCDMMIKIVGDAEECEVVGDSCGSVLKNLSDLRKQHQLLFSPNLSLEGVRGKKNWDGLIYAMVCGTLHQRTGVVGHFKQSFVLSTDPYAQHSCKIKESTLILISSKAVPSHSQQMLMPNAEKVNPLAVNASSHLAINAPSHLEITDVS